MRKFMVLLLLLMIVPAVFANSGSIKLLAVSNPETNPKASLANLYLEIKPGQGRIFIDSYPLSRIDTQISTRFAKEVACDFLEKDCSKYDFFYTIRSSSSIIGGPSAGAAISVLTISVLDGLTLDENVAMTGTINTGGLIGPVGSILPKIDGAGQLGIKKILIPKYSDTNQTNITFFEARHGIEVVEVSMIGDAIYEFTGKNYTTSKDVEIDGSYVETMGMISEELCKRAESLYIEVYRKYENVTAFNLLEKGQKELSLGHYYSAASFCFGSGLQLRNRKLQELKKEQVKIEILDMLTQVDRFINSTKATELRTITDLESYMAVMSRATESHEKLIDAYNDLNSSLNSSIYQLAYATERLNSAHSWAQFFGTKGKEFILDKYQMERSCLQKISEVEERIQYVELYLPDGGADAKRSVEEAYAENSKGNPEMCLYESSLAKARINLLLNSISIDPVHVDEVINDRITVVKQLLAKQSRKGIFPIVAYSYYEYGSSLKETDKYSALLYLEYALELGSLDIYFEKEKPTFYIQREYLIMFGLGTLFGLLVGLLIMVTVRKKKGKK
jgi:uncharacterized protein